MSIESVFPEIKKDGYVITSQVTSQYNCIAWAAGDDSAWWDPAEGYYWPENIPRKHSADTLRAVFSHLGYVECESAQREEGYDKVALYGDDGEWTHAARMLGSGRWTSKLGPQEDIEHSTPMGLVGADYGKVLCIMKRPVSGVG
jgi:hypothetical protein